MSFLQNLRKTLSEKTQAFLAPARDSLRGLNAFSTSGLLLLALLLDFSIWLSLFCKLTALLLQTSVLVKLGYEEKYLHLRFRRLSWQKKAIPLALFGVCLLFFVEKALLISAMWQTQGLALTHTYRSYSIIFFLSAFAIYALRINVIARFLSRLRLRPAQTLAVGFMCLILIGGLLLSLPQMVSDPSKISIIDAFFTATSASTVTGLVVAPISEYYRPGGTWVILCLIQLGGLGIMTFGVLFSLLSKQRMRLDDAIALQGVLDAESVGTVRKEIQRIFLLTLTIEALGTLLLWLILPEEGAHPLFSAAFHAVSAFCNAGFSLFPDNLEGYVQHLPLNFIVAALVIAGGLGFPVLSNLGNYPLFRKNRASWRLSFHTKMVLSVSAGLLIFGTLGIYFIEYSNTLSALSWHEKWASAFFQAVTARTAGFNTLKLGQFSGASLFLMMLLMWIGGSPASTAGGIKTTTFGVMLATLGAVLRGRKEVSLFKRGISPSAVQKSLAIGFTSFALLSFFLLMLLYTETADFEGLMFEAVSAFNTVGLSTGITSTLSPAGKIILILTMFVGRIGPLTLAFSLAERVRKGKYSYPEERVIVG